jgi:hypothetical protein
MKALVVVGVLAAMVASTVAARADQHELIGDPPESVVERSLGTPALDLDLRLGLRGFRFGSRLFGREGYAGGAWLNAETRPDGFSVDGRIERGGKVHNFKLNADIDEWVRRATRWWGVTDL